MRAEAREALKGKWNVSALVALVYVLVSLVIQAPAERMTIVTIILGLTIGVMVSINLYYIFQDLLLAGKKPEIGELFSFKNYWKVLATTLLAGVLIIIGVILLIIPGIIVAIGLSQYYYILREHPEYSPAEVLSTSWKMMKGHKMEFFILGLSFIGWALLGIICVVGILWVIPYVYTAMAAFYRKLKENEAEPVIVVEETVTV